MTALERLGVIASGKPPTWVSWTPVLLRDPCAYCIVWPMAHRALDRKTVEHVTPLSHGGANRWENKATAHLSCNTGRGNLPLLRFLRYRQAVAAMTGKANRRARKALRRQLAPTAHVDVRHM